MVKRSTGGERTTAGAAKRGGAGSLDDIRRKDGLLVRWTDGTLYFIPKAVLDQHVVAQVPEGVPGAQAGDDLQSVMDRLPPVYRVKNAIRTLGDAFDDLLDLDQPGGVFKPKTEALSKIAEGFPASRGYRAWAGHEGTKDRGDD